MLYPFKNKNTFGCFCWGHYRAIPFMLGWVAATNEFGIEPGTLFMIQFFWQFPHFWALGWMLDDDYKRGGFKMLPTGRKDKGTALQIIMYIIWMLVISVIPAFGITGRLQLSIPAAVIIFLMGMVMLIFAFLLYEKRDNITARKLMLASVSYITLMQVVYVVDKFI
ncbi:protoheme IX farnesyltransferase [Zobellia laminariae]|uniref:protoheme IX farnesyltransferase n=1 Tax=Zobellia laminariae TaxID=248906 RepID=UPI0026F4130A|nr:UbiA family prenyltransferase [Zobellia laminariae]WKX78497.1 UbiA family prenyltransferase [Zobellia laminariae]